MKQQNILGMMAGGLLCIPPLVSAQNVERGSELAVTCLGCHAIEGYYNVYPTYRVPKLGGQTAKYIESALRAYRDGQRVHDTMHANAADLSDEDIANIAAFVAN